MCADMPGGTTAKVVKHVTVYQEAGRFGGWPANHGIWVWGNEILVGFSAAYFQWNEQNNHPYDRSKPEEPRLARSLDGGETWTTEAPANLVPPAGMFTGSGPGGQAQDLREPLDFTRPGFAMTLRMTDAQKGRSWLFYSYDRGKTWTGPINFPMLGQTAINARTDYIVNGRRDALVFVTAAKPSGREGRPLCARTRDGGLHWFRLLDGSGSRSGFHHHVLLGASGGERNPDLRASRGFFAQRAELDRRLLVEGQRIHVDVPEQACP
jgi:hypothetical protein